MGLRWLVNAVFLALPIGATIGILLGIDLHRHASGQEPLFNDNDGAGGTGSIIGPGKGDNRVTINQYCQKQVGVSPATKGVQYTLNPNQWGWTEGTPGAMCMNVTAFRNNTYATDTTAPQFTVTWQYPQGPESQPVHAFPNIQIEGLPIKLQSVTNINVNAQWTYGVGNTVAESTNAQELLQHLVNTNVAMDMFLDADKTNSQNSSKAGYEVMVWFADFGPAAQPIGLKNGTVATEVVNGTTFNLYTGQNGLGQNVLTWMASEMTEDFSGDISPLLTQLSSIEKADFPFSSLYLGHLGIGSEAFSADTNVTFSMPVLSIDLKS